MPACLLHGWAALRWFRQQLRGGAALSSSSHGWCPVRPLCVYSLLVDRLHWIWPGIVHQGPSIHVAAVCSQLSRLIIALSPSQTLLTPPLLTCPLWTSLVEFSYGSFGLVPSFPELVLNPCASSHPPPAMLLRTPCPNPTCLLCMLLQPHCLTFSTRRDGPPNTSFCPCHLQFSRKMPCYNRAAWQRSPSSRLRVGQLQRLRGLLLLLLRTLLLLLLLWPCRRPAARLPARPCRPD